MCAGMIYLPYSARWLALKGRNDEARAAMEFVSPDVTDDEVNAVLQSAAEVREGQQNEIRTSSVDRTFALDNEASDRGRKPLSDGLNGRTGADVGGGDLEDTRSFCEGLAADWKRFNSPAVRPALVAGLGVVLLQQVTGQPSVLYVDIFGFIIRGNVDMWIYRYGGDL